MSNAIYDARLTLWKGAKSLLITGASVALAAVAAYWSDPLLVSEVLTKAGAPVTVVAVVAPILTSLVRMADNWRKHA